MAHHKVCKQGKVCCTPRCEIKDPHIILHSQNKIHVNNINKINKLMHRSEEALDIQPELLFKINGPIVHESTW